MFMRKSFNSFLLFILSVCLILNYFCLGIYASNHEKNVIDEDLPLEEDFSKSDTNENFIQASNNDFKKLHFYTIDRLSKYYDIDGVDELFEAIEVIRETFFEYDFICTIAFNFDFSKTDEYKELMTEKDIIKNNEEFKEFNAKFNTKTKEYYHKTIQENLHLFDNCKINDLHELGYSPYITGTIRNNDLTVELVLELIKLDLSSISFALPHNVSNNLVDCNDNDNESTPDIVSSSDSLIPPVSAQVSWNTAMNESNASYIMSHSHGGEGIKIGIIESGGYCDLSNANLVGKNITVNGSTISQHATTVTSIIALMAPNSEIYCYEYDEPGIQSLLDQHCQVINISYSYLENRVVNGIIEKGPRIYRQDIDGLIDSQIANSLVVVCIAAGNYNNSMIEVSKYNPYREIASPGYAHNAITVSGVEKICFLLIYK